MSKAQVDAIRALLASRPRGEQSLAERRAGFERLAAGFPVPPDIAVVPNDDPPGLWIAPPDPAPGRLLLYLHGGAFMVGSARSHAELVGRVARAAGLRAFSLDYRLAPEHPFPAALDDAVAAWRALRAEHPAAAIAVAGDSAGGNLAAALVLRLLAEGDPVPAAVALLSPYLDLTHSGDSIVIRAARDPFIDPAGMDRTAATYLGDHARIDSLASPLFAHLAGFPPVLVQVGEDEVLYDDSARFVERARAAGVDAVLDPWPDMIHVFQFFALHVEEGAAAIERIGGFLRDRLGGSGPD